MLVRLGWTVTVAASTLMLAFTLCASLGLAGGEPIQHVFRFGDRDRFWIGFAMYFDDERIRADCTWGRVNVNESTLDDDYTRRSIEDDAALYHGAPRNEKVDYGWKKRCRYASLHFGRTRWYPWDSQRWSERVGVIGGTILPSFAAWTAGISLIALLLIRLLTFRSNTMRGFPLPPPEP